MSAEFESNIVSVERIKEYQNTPHEVGRLPYLITLRELFLLTLFLKAEWTIESTKPSKSWPTEGKIEFANYSVKYREDLENVLSDINLSIRSGEKVSEQLRFLPA